MAEFERSKDSSYRDKQLKQLKKVYEKEGITGLSRQLKENLSEWKQTSLKIAVTGKSGTGKSTFINALRGITADDKDKDPAAVGVNETTIEVKEYRFPGNDKFMIYDVPGLGTKKFKRENYLAQIKAKDFDFFIIITKTRFFEDEIWLAEQLHSLKKRFYFVRSHCQEDINNDKVSHPKTHNQAQVLQEMKKNIRNSLGEKFADVEIFLIDNYERTLYDFTNISMRIINDSDVVIKKDSLVFSLIGISREVIEEKKRRLEKRLPFVLLLCCFWRSYIKIELKLYRKTFGLDDDSLEEGMDVLQLDEKWCMEQKFDVQAVLDQLENDYNSMKSTFPSFEESKKTLVEALEKFSSRATYVLCNFSEGLVNANIA